MPSETRRRGPAGPVKRPGMVAAALDRRQQPARVRSDVVIDLRTPWKSVEVPTRLVLAPMAGVSVQAFRRQGRRYGAGLVCSETVSCAGIEHRNERTLGYLRVAADEHPLAIQLFGSEPRTLANAAKMVEAVGADLVDVNFGCPVRKVTRTGAGATLLDDPALACAIVESVADAVAIPSPSSCGAASGTAPARVSSWGPNSSTQVRRRSPCTRARPSRCTPAAPITRSPRSSSHWSTFP